MIYYLELVTKYIYLPVLIFLPVIIIPTVRHVHCSQTRRRFLPGMQ